MPLFDDSAEVSLETLVGEGKKYKTPDDLAKAYNHADATIQARNEELQQLRDELNSRVTVEEAIQKLSTTQRQAAQDDSGTGQNPPKNETPAKPAADDLDSRINEALQKTQRETLVRQNQEIVLLELLKLYGTEEKANEVIRAKAKDLGVSVQFLQSVATQSPKAFFAQLGVNASNETQRNASPSRGEVNAAALGLSTGVQPGSYEFYENIRATDPRRYFTPKVQNQLMQDAFDGKYITPAA